MEQSGTMKAPLRQRNLQCGKIQPEACGTKAAEESRQGQKRNRCRGFSAARGGRTNADRFVRKRYTAIFREAKEDFSKIIDFLK